MKFLENKCAGLVAPPAPISVTRICEDLARSLLWVRNQLSLRSVSQCGRFLGVMVRKRGSRGD